jgi:hypothetical protein
MDQHRSRSEDSGAHLPIAKRNLASTNEVLDRIARHVLIVSPKPRDNGRWQKYHLQSRSSNLNRESLVRKVGQCLIKAAKRLQRPSPDHQRL